MNPRIRLAHRIAIGGARRCDFGESGPLGMWSEWMEYEARDVRNHLVSGKCPSVISDNVSQMYYSRDKVWTDSDFPSCVPPFENMFCEWNEFTKSGDNCGTRVGCYIQTADFEKSFDGIPGDMARDVLVELCDRHMFEAVGRNEHTVKYRDSMRDPKCRFSYRMSYFLIKPGFPCPGILPIEVRGTLSRDGDRMAGYYSAHPSMRWDGGTFQSGHIPRLAFTLMSCKNVATEQASTDDLPDAKWLRRQGDKVKGLVFKTLRIDGMGSGSRSTTGEPSGEHNRFHICRGSFAEYTAEKPLFGKYTGRFWRPAHVKGSKEVGEVVKEYDVGPRSEVPQEVTN